MRDGSGGRIRRPVLLGRRCCDALNRRDLDGYLATISDDIALHSQFAGVEGRTYRGHVEVPRYFQDMAEASHRFLVEPLDLVESREGKVACTYPTRAEALEAAGLQE